MVLSCCYNSHSKAEQLQVLCEVVTVGDLLAAAELSESTHTCQLVAK